MILRPFRPNLICKSECIQLRDKQNVLCGYHLVAKGWDFHVLTDENNTHFQRKEDSVNQVTKYFTFLWTLCLNPSGYFKLHA